MSIALIPDFILTFFATAFIALFLLRMITSNTVYLPIVSRCLNKSPFAMIVSLYIIIVVVLYSLVICAKDLIPDFAIVFFATAFIVMCFYLPILECLIPNRLSLMEAVILYLAVVVICTPMVMSANSPKNVLSSANWSKSNDSLLAYSQLMDDHDKQLEAKLVLSRINIEGIRQECLYGNAETVKLFSKNSFKNVQLLFRTIQSAADSKLENPSKTIQIKLGNRKQLTIIDHRDNTIFDVQKAFLIHCDSSHVVKAAGKPEIKQLSDSCQQLTSFIEKCQSQKVGRSRRICERSEQDFIEFC